MRFVSTPFAKKNTSDNARYSPRPSLPSYFLPLALLILSMLVVSCGSSASANTANTGDPSVTVTINVGNGGSPTPTLPAYECGAWATQAAAPYGTRVVGVYAKFVQLVNGNPVGVVGANAIATVIWPDGTTSTIAGTTGSDGLVTFAVSTAGRADALMKLVFITVAFTANGVPPCNVTQDRAAFFMLTNGTSDTPTATTGTTGGGTTGGGTTGGGSPGPQPTVGTTPVSTPVPTPPIGPTPGPPKKK